MLLGGNIKQCSSFDYSLFMVFVKYKKLQTEDLVMFYGDQMSLILAFH